MAQDAYGHLCHHEDGEERPSPRACRKAVSISWVELAQVAPQGPEFWCCARAGVAESVLQRLEVAAGGSLFGGPRGA